MANPILENKLELLRADLAFIMRQNTITYNNDIEATLLQHVSDIIEHPDSIDILLEESDIDAGLSAEDFIILESDIIRIVDTCDKLLDEVGGLLNDTITQSLTNLETTNAKLKEQLTKISRLENDVVVKNDNISIYDERRYKKSAITEFSGTANVTDIITFPFSKIAKTVQAISTTIISTPTNNNSELKLRTEDVGGKTDTEIFTDGWYCGNREPSLEFGPPSLEDRTINNAMDPRISKYAEYEYITYSKPTTKDPMKMVVVSEVTAKGYTNIMLELLTDANVSLKYSLDNKMSWVDAKLRKATISGIQDSKKVMKEYMFLIPTSGKSVVYLEYHFENSTYTQIDVPRIRFKTPGKERTLNYVESGYLESAVGQSLSIGDTLKEMLVRLKTYYKRVYEKMSSGNHFNYVINSTEVVSIPAYRYSITIPTITASLIDSDMTMVEYIAKLDNLSNDIAAIELEVDEDIPETKDTDYIEYSFSPDKVTWYTIRPVTVSVTDRNRHSPTRLVYDSNMATDSFSRYVTTNTLRTVYMRSRLYRDIKSGIPSIEDFRIRIKEK